jgi:hypothetical protein
MFYIYGRNVVGELLRIPPAGEVHRLRLSRHQHRRAAQQASGVWSSAALRDEPATRLQALIEAAEKARVVWHPVEGGSAEDAIFHTKSE